MKKVGRIITFYKDEKYYDNFMSLYSDLFTDFRIVNDLEDRIIIKIQTEGGMIKQIRSNLGDLIKMQTGTWVITTRHSVRKF